MPLSSQRPFSKVTQKECGQSCEPALLCPPAQKVPEGFPMLRRLSWPFPSRGLPCTPGGAHWVSLQSLGSLPGLVWFGLADQGDLTFLLRSQLGNFWSSCLQITTPRPHSHRHVRTQRLPPSLPPHGLSSVFANLNKPLWAGGSSPRMGKSRPQRACRAAGLPASSPPQPWPALLRRTPCSRGRVTVTTPALIFKSTSQDQAVI